MSSTGVGVGPSAARIFLLTVRPFRGAEDGRGVRRRLGFAEAVAERPRESRDHVGGIFDERRAVLDEFVRALRARIER